VTVVRVLVFADCYANSPPKPRPPSAGRRVRHVDLCRSRDRVRGSKGDTAAIREHNCLVAEDDR
jgi:hypothetical protein